jgi:hypothetical protein
VLIEKQMQLIEGVACYLPMMLFVEVAKGNGVGENLIQIFRAFGANVFIERNRKLGKLAVGLNFARVLMKKGPGTFRSGLRVGPVIGLGIFGHRAISLNSIAVKNAKGYREYER